MNLVQIQERLKDLPTQAIMAYANGQNPQVPPYLALGELNRRKQMEKQSAQPPQGTVKDNIEQQMGLMQTQKARQGQMAQQSAMQGANAPMIPQGTPEPEMQPEAEMAMAGGGVTSLPVGDMNFGSGGIIAFADGDLVDEAKAAAKAAKEKLYGYGLRQRQQDPEGYAAAQAELAAAEDKVSQSSRQNADLGPAGAMGKNIIPTAVTPQKYSRAPGSVYTLPEGSPVPSIENTYMDKQGGRLARPPGVSDEAWRQYVAKNSGTQQTATFAGPGDRMVPRYPSATPPVGAIPPGGIANVVPPRVTQQNAPVAQPAVSSVAEPVQPAASASPLMDILKKKIAETAPALPDYETERTAAALKNPFLTMQPGKKLEEGIAGLRKDYGKQQEAFDKNEEAAARAALWKGLIEGGESTRGIRGKGLASLGTGAGKSFLTSMEGARTREMAQKELVAQRNFNLTKMESELENARIAEAKGDFKSAYDHKIKAAEFKQNAAKDQNQLLGQGAQIESADNREAMRLRNEKELAEIRFKYEKQLKNIPQAQRASFEEQFVEEAVKRGMSKLEAMREAKTLGNPRSQLTYAQAADDVDNFLKNNPGYIAGQRKAAKDAKQPIPDDFTIRKTLIDQQMQQSGSSNAPKSKDLAAADAIAGVK
jgi:hypothetical protein